MPVFPSGSIECAAKVRGATACARAGAGPVRALELARARELSAAAGTGLDVARDAGATGCARAGARRRHVWGRVPVLVLEPAVDVEADVDGHVEAVAGA